MTRTMARTFCAFNAFVFFAIAIASGLVLTGVIPAALAATGVGCVSILCGMVMVSAAFFMSQARTRVREAVKAEEEKPALTPGQMLANQRWQRRA